MEELGIKGKNFTLDKTTLENRLKELAKTPSNEITKTVTGAMCYSPTYIGYEDYICPICKKITSHCAAYFADYLLEGLRKTVKFLKKKGYDVLLDETEFCQYCNKSKEIDYNKLKPDVYPDLWYKSIEVETPESIFKIRFDKADEYHTVKVYSYYNFRYILEFFTGNNMFESNVNREIHPLSNRIDKIHDMTGLGDEATLAEWKKISEEYQKRKDVDFIVKHDYR